MESITTWFAVNLGDKISPEAVVFLVSLMPILECRGGLLAASLLNVDLWTAIPICIVGNILPIPFILLGIKKLIHWMAEHHLSKVAEWLERKAVKNKPKIDKYGFLGLVLFVGIPLPGTGAWTGSLVASLFDMDIGKASLSILLGIFLAAVIMTTLSYGAGALFS